MPALHTPAHRAQGQGRASSTTIVKIGRTHLMDATPIRLGQEFSGYASQIAHADRRLMQSIVTLRELPIGGTAVGTGINTHPRVRPAASARSSATRRGESVPRGRQPLRGPGRQGRRRRAPAARCKTIAVSLTKIANDIRWLGSGPRCGIGELLPARDAARQLDHARQGQPGDLRGGDPGLRPGDRQRRGGHVRGGAAGQSRAEHRACR